MCMNMQPYKAHILLSIVNHTSISLLLIITHLFNFAEDNLCLILIEFH